MSTLVETPAVVKAEKEPRIALPVIAEADYKVLECTTASDVNATVAYLNISDINEYAQFAAVAKGCSQVKISGNAKGCLVAIDGSHPKNTDKVALLNPELAGKIVIATITYNGAERLRISAKNMGTSKVKASVRGTFFDRDLSGLVDMETYNYIFGKDGTECTKQLNTKICRAAKALVPFGLLYSDEDKSGFHKANSRIPSENRTKDNYSWYFIWEEIAAKLAPEVVLNKLVAKFSADALDAKVKAAVAANPAVEVASIALDANEVAAATAKATETQASLALDANVVISQLVAIIENVYPTIKVDTTKDLYIEALVSEFAAIKSEKFEFDVATGTVVSRKAEALAEKAKKVAEKEAARAEKKSSKKAKVAEEAAAAVEGEAVEVSDVAPVVVDAPVEAVVAPVSPVAPIAPIAPVSVAPVAPIAPVAPVAATILPGINANAILDNINPANV